MSSIHQNIDGLLMRAEDEPFGHMVTFDGRVFTPDGEEEGVSPDLVDAHNKALDTAYIAGLDKNCSVGEGGSFYLAGEPPRRAVITFSGMLVSTDVNVHRNVVTFRRNGKVFRGPIVPEALKGTGSVAFNSRRIRE